MQDFLHGLSHAIAHGQDQASHASVKRITGLKDKLDIAGYEVHELQMHNPAPAHIDEFEIELKSLIRERDDEIDIRFKGGNLPSFDSYATIRVKYVAGAPAETQSQIRDRLTAQLETNKQEDL